jgi:DnaJ-class molecular chaperone
MSTKAAAGPSAPETIECPLCSGTGELNSAGCRKCKVSAQLQERHFRLSHFE